MIFKKAIEKRGEGEGQRFGESWSSLPMLALMPELSVRGRRWRWLAVAGFRPVKRQKGV